MIMTQQFSKKDVEQIFKQYLAAQGYSLTKFSYDVQYGDLNSISCCVIEAQPVKTFIIPVGNLTAAEAEKNIRQLIANYRAEITLTEDKEEFNYPLPVYHKQIEDEKRNEN